MDSAVVTYEIAVLLLVLAAGAIGRRLAGIDDGIVRAGSRLAVDVAMPALLFTSLLDTTDRAALIAGWYVPLLGAAVLVAGWGLSALIGRLSPGSTPTFVFCAGLPNWVYLPLPIVAAAYGDDGVRIVLLVNLGAMPLLWTLGVWVLEGGAAWRGMLNPGMIASLAAIGLAWWDPTVPGELGTAVRAIGGALEQIGALAIPLSLLLTGAQLGGGALTLPGLPLVAVTVARLLIVPAITIGAILGLERVGLRLDGDVREILALIAAMPVALSASVFAERFGGDVKLASQSILVSTPLYLVTVPPLLALMR